MRFPSALPERSARRGSRPATVLHLVDADSYPDWESVYRDNVTRLFRVMYTRVGNRTDAEDLTAEVFRSVVGRLELGCSRGEVRAYLLMTAQTVLASYWRRRLGRSVTVISPETDIELLSDRPAEDDSSESREQAHKILAALPDRFRRILELRFLEASSIKEAASEMNVTVSNAKVLQHRALQMATRVAREMEEDR
jgi:RNA polymerase sigma-70 factor (ECF subfamily)